MNLNKCTNVGAFFYLLNSIFHPQNKEESEDDEYALSENWSIQQTKNGRRWSRVGEMDMQMQKPTEKMNSTLDTSRESSPETNDANDEQLGYSTLPMGISFSQSQGDEQEPVRLRRTGSERLKDGAKAFLRRVESIKSRRRKRQNRDGIVISGPQTLDLSHLSPKMNDSKCNIITMSTPPSPVPSSPYTTILTNNKHISAAFNNYELKVITNECSPMDEKLSPSHLSPRHFMNLAPNTFIHTTTHHSQSNRTSPLPFFTHNPSLTKDLKSLSGDDTSSYCSDASQESSGGGGGNSTMPKKKPSRSRRFLQKGSKVEDIGALSDSECHQILTRGRSRMYHDGNQLTVNSNNNNNNNTSTNNNNNNNSVDTSIELKPSKFSRGGSLNLGKESQKFKESFKTRSFRSRSSARVKQDGEFDHKFRTRLDFFFLIILH